MSKDSSILLLLFLYFSNTLAMEKPTASGSAYNFVRVAKASSCPMPPSKKDSSEGLRSQRSHSEHPFVFSAEDKKDKDLLVSSDLNDLGLSEEMKNPDKLLEFHKKFHEWTSSLPASQKNLFEMLPDFFTYRALYGSYFYGKKKNVQPDYEKACIKMENLMDGFHKHQLSMKLEKIRSFSLASYRRSSFVVVNNRYPISLFDRNLFMNHYRSKRDLFLADPLNDEVFLEILKLQEEVADLAKQEKLINEELSKK
jgi:hypothetical protein